jgi:hypothetical protein
MENTMKKHVWLMMLLVVPFSLFIPGCVTDQTATSSDAEIWIGAITGNHAQGDMKFEIHRTSLSGEYEVKGRFYGEINTPQWGRGRMEVKMDGQVKEGVFAAKLKGHASVEEGSSWLRGDMIGTMSKSQAFGTYELYHEEGKAVGDWSAEKADPANP